MAAFDGQAGFLISTEVHRLLLFGDGRGGLEGGADDEGHARADAAENATGVIAERGDFAAFDGEGVIVLRTPLARDVEATAELNAFDGRNGEEGFGDVSFQGIENRLAEAGRDIERNAFDDTADAIAIL